MNDPEIVTNYRNKSTQNRALCEQNGVFRIAQRAAERLTVTSTHREAHVRQLFDETIHHPRIFLLPRDLCLGELMTGHRHYRTVSVIFDYEKKEMSFLAFSRLTFGGPFLDALPQELQEGLLSWDATLFHMSPSSASH